MCMFLSPQAYIKNELPEVKAVYMVGEAGLEEELGMAGLRCVKEEDRPAAGMTEDEFRQAELDPEVRALAHASVDQKRALFGRGSSWWCGLAFRVVEGGMCSLLGISCR